MPSDPDELQKRLADMVETGLLIAEAAKRNPKPKRKHVLANDPNWQRSVEKARERLSAGEASRMGRIPAQRKQEAEAEVRRLLGLPPEEHEERSARAAALQRFMSDF